MKELFVKINQVNNEKKKLSLAVSEEQQAEARGWHRGVRGRIKAVWKGAGDRSG